MNEAKTAYADARENRVAGRLDEAERLIVKVWPSFPTMPIADTCSE